MILNTPKAILWDMDGVFVDTERLHFEAWKYMVEQLGSTFSFSEYSPLIGQSSEINMKKIFSAKNLTGSYEKLNFIRRRYYNKLRKKEVPIISKNVDLLKNFLKYFPNIEHSVVSNAPLEDIVDNIEILCLTGIFKTIVSFESREGLKKKPEPDLYLFALEILDHTPNKCLVFEDSATGVKAATLAGIRCVALPNKLTEAHDFGLANIVISIEEKVNAKYILEKLSFL